MTVCSTCGTENLPEARYCASCGIPLEAQSGKGISTVYCANCGAENFREAGFCNSCGTQIQAPPGRVTVVGEPQPQVNVEYMGFWIRLAAEILDVIIFGSLSFVVAILAQFVPLFGILYIPLFIYGFYKVMKGQTPGKRLLRMKVVNEAGEEISFWRGMLREIIGKPASAIIFYLGFIWVAFDSRKQGWHDKISGTYVIRRT